MPKEQLYWDRLAQDTSSLFGSILRIDIDRGFPAYGIAESNPFVGKPGRDEIYAFGFRNPYHIALDSLGTGDFLVTAIAETLWEAIYLVMTPGNFGSPIREGTHCVGRTLSRAGAISGALKKLEEIETRIISVAEDAEGELYVLTNDELGSFGKTGKIFRIAPSDD